MCKTWLFYWESTISKKCVEIVLPLTYIGKGTIREGLLNSTFVFLSGFLIWHYNQVKERTRQDKRRKENRSTKGNTRQLTTSRWILWIECNQQYVSLLQRQLEKPDNVIQLINEMQTQQISIMFCSFFCLVFLFSFLFSVLFFGCILLLTLKFKRTSILISANFCSNVQSF